MTELKRSLGLFDATALGIGAIVGAGIFVVSGVASGIAGPAVVLSILIAGAVSSFTAFSYVKLSSRIIESGGAYTYAEKTISPFVGFIAGSMWLFENIVAGATVSLGMASYLVSLFPVLPLIPIAVSVPLILVLLNIVGVKESSIFNALLVLLKLSALFLFITIGFSHLDFNNYTPFMPNGLKGVLSGAALIFFAFIGFGRAPTAAEEIRDPSKTVPRSIILALTLSSLIYVLASFVTVGLENYQALAQSGSPIADAAEHGIGLLWLKILVSFAAVAATLSVLLTTLIGVSRVSFAMARDGSIPRFLAKVHHKFHTPYLAIIVTGAATAILPFIGGLRQMANVTNFGSLFVYSIVNLSAVSLMKKSTSIKHSHIALSLVGFASCVMLMFFLEWQSWIIGTVWVIIALLYYMIARRWKKKQP